MMSTTVVVVKEYVIRTKINARSHVETLRLL